MGKYISLILVLVIFIGIFLFQVNSSCQINGGLFIYPLDDTYIHLAIAKNFAEHGVWGVTRHVFSSSSSSILYTLFLATLIKLFNVNDYYPLIVNGLAAIAIYIFLWRVAIKAKVHSFIYFSIAILSMLFTPIPALVLSGMEHTLQVLVDFVFIYFACSYLADSAKKNSQAFHLCILAALCVMIRFEGIFIVAVIGIIYLLKKRIKTAVLVIFCGVLPVLIYGIFSVKNGAFFLPNSLLIKGDRPPMNILSILKFSFNWLPKLYSEPHVLMMFILLSFTAGLQLIKDRTLSLRSTIWSIVTLLVLLLHLSFARTGWFFRYEAYLVFLFIVGFIWAIEDETYITKPFKKLSILQIAVFLPTILMVLYPFFIRSRKSLSISVNATVDIYSHPYQMAMFLKKYYNHSEVAANDIGAISYFTDIKLLDIIGLASNEVVTLRTNQLYDREHIYKLAKSKHIKVVVIYADGFEDHIPIEWKKAGEWHLDNIVVLGGDSVAFFATDDYDVEKLKQNLRDFSKFLPNQIIERGSYIQ